MSSMILYDNTNLYGCIVLRMCTLESALMCMCRIITFLITQMYLFPQMDETHDRVDGNGSTYQFHAEVLRVNEGKVEEEVDDEVGGEWEITQM